MRRTDFSFLPDRKRLLYEQIARSYRLQERRKNPPFVPFEKRLLESKIAVVSVTGAYLKDQKGFTSKESEQDYRFREIPLAFKHEDLDFFAIDWEPTEARKDHNVVLPVDRLILLQKEGLIGKIHETIYSFAGFNRYQKMLTKSIDRLYEALKSAEVDGALILPCSYRTGDTACQIALQLEQHGIPTVTQMPFYEQALMSGPPRSTFINFPFGRVFGRADHVVLHTAVLRDTLRLFEKAKIPGEVICLSFVWSFGKIPNW